MAKPTKAERRKLARVHVARNLITLIEAAMGSPDGGWAVEYTLGECPDEPSLLHLTAATDIEEALDDVIRHLARWIP